MVTSPSVNADSYLEEDSVTASPKHGTTVQAGWGAASAFLNKKAASSEDKYAKFLKFSDQAVLVRFLDDAPFKVYEEHWIDRTEGRRSFVCLGAECPLCTIAGDRPRPKFAFNVLLLNDGEPTTQVMIAVTSLAKLLQAAHEDPKKGPLTKYYWAIARLGMGRDTQYTLERVRATDLAEEWELDSDDIDEAVSSAVLYDDSVIYLTPRDELLDLARSLVS